MSEKITQIPQLKRVRNEPDLHIKETLESLLEKCNCGELIELSYVAITTSEILVDCCGTDKSPREMYAELSSLALSYREEYFI